MTRGVLYVASRPVSPEREEEYNDWYDNVHLADVCAVPGFLGARRYDPVGNGPHVAIYDIEGEDLGAIAGEMFARVGDGRIAISDAMATDPAPEVRILAERVTT
jgi:hypothetical protein